MLGTILLVWAALSGSIVDAATGRPIAGARVRTVARPDGGWEVAVCAPGYLDTFQHGRAGEGVGRIELFPAAPGPEVEARILAERAARPRGLAAEGAADLRPQARAILEAHEAGQTPPIAYTLAAPPTIRVWRRGVDGSTASCSGRVDTLALEDYVKGVVPHEWISSWQAESLKAGAMAARSYAWYWVAAGGKYSCADVDDTTASQVYRDSTNSATDAAVEATAGQGIVRSGAIVFAEYSAENGDPTADGVDEPYCAGQTVNGHGHGMCQWGTQRWAMHDKDYRWMVSHYYPGATTTGPDYAASYQDRDAPMEMTSGDVATVYLEYQNQGAATWSMDTTRVGTTVPRDRASPFFDAGNWINDHRPTGADHSTYGPGDVGRFTFTLRAPDVTSDTSFTEHFGLVQENVTWFGPPDGAVALHILVHPRGGAGSGGAGGGGSGGAPGIPPPGPIVPAPGAGTGCAVGVSAAAPGGLALGCAILLPACVLSWLGRRSLWRSRLRRP